MTKPDKTVYKIVELWPETYALLLELLHAQDPQLNRVVYLDKLIRDAHAATFKKAQ